MKYFISRASLGSYEATPPCKEAILYKYFMTKGKDEQKYIWYVNINNINNLWHLMNQYGKIIIEPINSDTLLSITDLPEWPEIIIYDDYIE